MAGLLLAGCAESRLDIPWLPIGNQKPIQMLPPAQARTAPTPTVATPAVPQANVPPAAPVIAAPAPPRDGVAVQPLEAAAPPPPAPPPNPLGGLRRPPADAIRVAVLVPLTGQTAAVGRALLEAAQLALFEVGDERLTLLPRDTGGSPETAAKAAEAVLQEGAELIIGPLFAGEVNTVAPLARARGVPVMAFSTDRSVAGRGVYLLGLTPEDQVERVIAFSRAKGLARFAALTPESPYGNAVLDALRRAAQKAGGEVTQVQTYATDSTDLTPVVRRFANYESRRQALQQQKKELEGKEDEISKLTLARLQNLETIGEAGFDAILLPEGGTRLKALAPLLPYYEIDPKKVRFLGTGQWDDASIVTEPALQGGWFASTDPAGVADFRQRYEATYGRRPLRIASLGFDAVALAAVLARDGVAQPFSADRLTNPNGFAGYDGIFRFRPDGLNERGLAILEVQPRGFRVVDPAPASFTPATN